MNQQLYPSQIQNQQPIQQIQQLQQNQPQQIQPQIQNPRKLSQVQLNKENDDDYNILFNNSLDNKNNNVVKQQVIQNNPEDIDKYLNPDGYKVDVSCLSNIEHSDTNRNIKQIYLNNAGILFFYFQNI